MDEDVDGAKMVRNGSMHIHIHVDVDEFAAVFISLELRARPENQD